MFGDAELVARVGGEGVAGVKLDRDLAGELGGQTAAHVDGRHLGELLLRIVGELGAFAGEVGRLAVGLGADGDVFARRHGHGAGDQTGQGGEDQGASVGVGGGHAHDQTGGRDDAVIGAQHGGAEPADPGHGVTFAV